MRKLIAFLISMSIVLCLSPASATEEFRWDVPKETLLAGLMEASISSIRGTYEAGLLTCREVTEYYLERIASFDAPYNCFITLCEEEALQQADRIDERMAAGDLSGLLFGIPIVVKDNIDYAGYHTTNGYDKRESQIADSNAQIVDFLLQQGAVIIGKTNMSTAAQDAKACYSQVAGETKNAYNTHLASGASSGGSAVATALNFATLGIGTDTNASLRLPAVLNGCISLRVTWDTLSLDGIEELNARRDVPGVITRTVRDQAIALDALSGGATSYADHLDSGVLEGLRLGMIKELTYPGGGEDREIIAAFEAACKELESCGAEVIPVSVPGIENWNYIYNDSEDYRIRKIELLEQIMEESGISAFLFPSYLSPPQYSGRDENGVYRNTADQPFLNNTGKLSPNVGIPEIGIPIGFHSRGAGMGMEIAAGKGQEQLLLDIAYAYTIAYDHRQPPRVGNLYARWYRDSLVELCGEYLRAVADHQRRTTPTETEAPPTEQEAAPGTLPAEASTEPTAPTVGERHSLRPASVLAPVGGSVVLAIVAGAICLRKKNK